MVGARSTPRSLAPQGGGYARAARPRPRLPVRLPLLSLLVLVLVALVLGQQQQHNSHARRAHRAQPGAVDAAPPLADADDAAAAAAALLGPRHELAPREATRRALELLDSLHVPPPPPRGRSDARARLPRIHPAFELLDSYVRGFLSWGPLGALSRLAVRLRLVSSRPPTWESVAPSQLSGNLLSIESEAYASAAMWPAWAGGWTRATSGPFLCSSAEQKAPEPKSYSDRIIAWAARPLTSRLASAPRTPPALSDAEKAANERRAEALALLHHAGGLSHAALSSPYATLRNLTFEARDPDALLVLATLSQHGLLGLPVNVEQAKLAWEALAVDGNTTAHTQLGWLHGGAWVGGQAGQAKALVHYHIAATAGDAAAQMSLGYRYHAGIGVSQNCEAALTWYEKAAEQAFAKFKSGPPGGLTLPYTKLRISDSAGGAYGPGASAASTGLAARRPAMQAVLHALPATDPNRLEDLLEFYTHHATRGHAGFALRLASIWYGGNVWAAGEGAGRVGRDYGEARKWCLKVTETVWPVDSKQVKRGGPAGYEAGKGQPGEDITLKVDEVRQQYAAVAASMMGRMFLRGEGVEQDFKRAWVWFRRAADFGNTEAYNGIGVMLRDGLGVPVDMRKAVGYFEGASNHGVGSSHEGCVNLGKIHLEMGDINNAAKYFEMAMRLGNSFEAPYHLATINARLARSLLGMYGGPETAARPVGPAGSPSHERCRLAVAGFKHAVERGDWTDPLFARAERAWDKGERERALSLWAMAGERGYEAAQNNVAWLLDRDKRRLHLSALEEQHEVDEAREASRDRLALIHWTRSAAQDNVDALVKMGDYYFKGIGITPGALDVEQAGGAGVSRTADAAARSASGSSGAAAPQRSGRSEPAYDKAAACYAAAADRQVSALAYWNMGFLYESGLGVPQHDYALAKRYYDMAVEINHEAYLPVLLSLAKLHLRAIWATLRHGDASAIALLKSYAFSAAGAAPDGAAPAYTEAEEKAALAALERLGDGRAGRGAPAGDGARGGLLRPDANAMGEGGDPNLPETYDVRRRGSSADEEDDEELDDIIEGAFIVIGLAALAFLVYARQGAALRAERERRDLAQAQQGGAAPPGTQETGGPRPRLNERPEPPFPWPPEGANVYAGL